MNPAEENPPRLPPTTEVDRRSAVQSTLSHRLPEDVRAFMERNRPRSHSPVSRFKVSAVGETEGFDLIPGVNIEFPGTTLNETVHGEQTVVAVAHARGVPRIDTFYLNAAPCGHCRQHIHELATDPVIWLDGRPPQRLSAYLPDAFGPKDLGIEGGALSPNNHALQLEKSEHLADPAAALALWFARRSYAPYTKAYGGVVFTLNDGRLCPGSYIENAGFNPSLSPFHSASANLIANMQGSFDQIVKVTLVAVSSTAVDHLDPAKRLLRSVQVACPVEMLTAVAAE